MKKWIAAGVIIPLILSTIIYRVYDNRNFTVDGNNRVLYSGKIISDVYTDKSRYNPGELVKVRLELNNTTSKDFEGSDYVYLKHLGKSGEIKEEKLSIKSGEKGNVVIPLKLLL